jgi:NAD(P)H dehydrogenase (quinone)
MYAITGITGQVGGAVAEALLAQGHAVRAVLRNPAKAQAWKARGCEIALADIDDVAALSQAFWNVDGVFVLLPPVFDPSPGFAEGKAAIAALHGALAAAQPPRIVGLSTIGAQATQPNLLNVLGMMEASFSELPLPVTFLRAAWFMENALWDVPAARDEGVLRSFLQPLDKAFPMVATRDVGRLAAALLQETWAGKRVVEIEGPQRVTPPATGRRLRPDAGACGARRRGATRQLAIVVRQPGHAKPDAARADDRRLQRGLDPFRIR